MKTYVCRRTRAYVFVMVDFYFLTDSSVLLGVFEQHGSCSSRFVNLEMSPANPPRQLLVWSLPTIAVLLSYLWFKRRKNLAIRADTEGIDPATSTRLPEPTPEIEKQDKTKISPASSPMSESTVTTPTKPVSFSRSLSGVESTPIDIKTGRSAPLVISDTELDLEIEKIKSMKNGTSIKKHSQMMASATPKRRAPKKAAPVSNNTSAVSNASNTSVVSNTSDTSTSTTGVEELQHHRRGHSAERDSANHSPVDAMMPASPSLSSISDNQSDSDSGKGGSDVATPPPVQQQQLQSQQSEAHSLSLPDAAPSDIADVDIDLTVYEFVIPQQLVGRLIGRHGAFVHTIREKTNARIIIKRHPDHQSKLKICSIEGLSSEIDAALGMIRDKFPVKRFPELTLEQISYVPIVPDCMHLRLIEGVNNDTIVSCVQSPAHLFLQQPTHPTFPNLNMLVEYMMYCYGDANCQTQPPLLPTPITPGTICAAECDNRWYRASVTSTEEENGIACIQFLDYGGYANVSYSQLRQIRGDFILLPFQAAECMLANVEPAGEVTETEDGWSQEAYDTVLEMTRGKVVFTQVVDYLEDGVIPLVRIYIQSGEQRGAILLNKVLADRGYARWVETR